MVIIQMEVTDPVEIDLLTGYTQDKWPWINTPRPKVFKESDNSFKVIHTKKVKKQNANGEYEIKETQLVIRFK